MAVGADEFACPGRPPPREVSVRLTGADAAYGGRGRRTAVGAEKFSAFEMKTAQRGVYSTLRGKCGSMVRTSSCVQDDRRPEGRSSVFAGSVARSFVTPVSPVTRIQSPIKENLEKNAFLQNH